MGEFLQGTASFFQTMAPIAAQAPGAIAPIVEMYASFARQFNLGRSAETALDQLAQMATQAAQNPPPNPQAEAMKAEMEQEAQKTQADMQVKQGELEIKREEAAAKFGLEQQKLQLEAAKLEFERQKAAREFEDRAAQRQHDADGALVAAGMPPGFNYEQDKAGMNEALQRIEQMNAAVLNAIGQIAEGQAQLAGAVEQMGAYISAPKELVRDANGRPVGVRPVLQ